MSFATFWKQNIGCARLAIQHELEYRFNLLTDTVFQPLIVAAIEVTIWWAICETIGTATIGGYSRESYLTYALWSAFFARIYMNWLYEGKMLGEIYSGSVNTILVRPISFFRFYLAQFLGYKAMTGGISLLVPCLIVAFVPTTTIFERLPLALCLLGYFLIMVHTIAFLVSSFGFFYNRVHAISVAKNITLWMLSGELFPLDLAGEPYRSILVNLPFAAGAYVPIGYLTGRVEAEQVYRSFGSVTIGIAVFGLAGALLWRAGLKRYAGTGA